VDPLQLVGLVLTGLGIGLMLGTLGGGGAIVTAPILVSVFGLGVRDATAVSLVVVLVAALSGLLGHARAKRVNWRAGVVFGSVGVLGAVPGAWLAGRVPESVLIAGFAVLLLVAGAAMWRGPVQGSAAARPVWLIAVVALVVGVVIGFFGVGGGFVIVPALVLVLGYPMPMAAATGLLVIAIDATAALVARGPASVDLPVAIPLAVAAVVGSQLGARWSGRIPMVRLQRSFAVLMLVTAVGMGLRLASV
jgi:uncharacterized membrane protein YfcA